MLRYVLLGLLSLAASGAIAQQSPPQNDASSAQPAPSLEKAVVPMEEPRPGDRWIYEVRDEVTGTITTTRTTALTEVTQTEIAMRFTNAGSSEANLVLFDRSWNIIQSGPWRHSPHDGSGVQMPLSVGKTWSSRSNETNPTNGNGWKRSSNSKVVGQEKLVTKAGTFETFKIEMTSIAQSIKDPTRKVEATAEMWYAPAIDHWVKRTNVTRANKHVLNSISLVLVDYGRKQKAPDSEDAV
jgi:hypothetical protein